MNGEEGNIEFKVAILGPRRVGKTSLITALLSETQKLLAGTPVAVLGEMRELGDFSAEAHRYVGRLAAEQPLGLLVTVGPAAEEIGRVAAGTLDPDRIQAFGSTPEAVERLPDLLQSGDVVLIKGSRAMEMEKIVQALTGAAESDRH